MLHHPWHDLPLGPNPPHELNAIVEIPRGSRNKYELDKETGFFKFDRLLYSAVYYPGDYGFFPRTLADDGDPLDVVVMVTVPTFPGCLVVVRPIGVFRMSDEKGLDEKILAVPVHDPLYEGYHRLSDAAPHFLREVEHFFAIYKELEGKKTEILGWEAEGVAEIVENCRARYDAAFPAGATSQPGGG
ncbi:MAG TPA: inorganic diphosphatase [Longimicrobiales bacterium]|nr:inorganic diphosphatase [Longimicrobiales bacterium]